jgi:putative SOS response-associated peptidase YedK
MRGRHARRAALNAQKSALTMWRFGSPLPPRVAENHGRYCGPTVEGLDVSDSRLANVPRRYNAAPSQELLVIRQNHKTGERSLDLLKWGLIPHWCSHPRGGRRPINAKAESVSRLPMFKDAYALRRCIVPVDGFFEWRAIKGARAKQPYAIAMKDGSPFGLAGLFENWRNPKMGDVRYWHLADIDADAEHIRFWG